MIVGRALGVAAVAADLPSELGNQHLPPELFPASAGGELRQRPARDVQRQAFAKEVSVRAEVVRQVLFDLRQLRVDAEEHIDRPGFLDPVRVRKEEIQCPQPRDRSQRELQHTRPVDADQRRVVGEPAGQLLLKPIAVTGVVGQPACAPQREPMLMTIQLPDDLVVAAGCIQVIDRRPEASRRPALMDRVDVPVGQRMRSRIRGLRPLKPQSGVAKQIVFAGQNAVRACRRLAGRGREPLQHRRDEPASGRRMQREPLRSAEKVPRQGAVRVEPLFAIQGAADVIKAVAGRKAGTERAPVPARRLQSGRDTIARASQRGRGPAAKLDAIHPDQPGQCRCPAHGHGAAAEPL